jgi:nicotinate-nucleotide pyrophosphorylase (carboxylating)
MFDVSSTDVRELLKRALAEDTGSGDITSRLTVREDIKARGKFLAMETLVLAGVELLPLIYAERG